MEKLETEGKGSVVRSSTLERMARALAVGVSLTTASLPAFGQDRPTPPAPHGRLIEPHAPKSAETPTSQDQVSREEAQRNLPTAKAISVSENSTQIGLLSAFATACSMSAMGWYLLQLKRGETKGSVTTGGLCVANNLLLAGAALMTGQGIGPAAMMTGYAVVGALCVRVLMQQNTGALEFSKRDKICTAACLGGWATLGVSLLPAARAVASPELLSFIGSITGTVVNTVACWPLMEALLAKPRSDELTQEARLHSPMKPVLPYLLSTAAMTAALLSVATVTVQSVAQPAILLLNTIALTGMVGIWAFRRRALP